MANEQSPQPGVLQAVVFGASGITGYALLKQLLAYPTPTTFSRVIGLTRRPLRTDVALLPEDQRIELYSDLDLTNREQTLFHLQHIPGIEHTTHVFFAAYAGHGTDYQELKSVDCEILTNATGGKAYGVEFSDKVPYNPPLSESLPRIPEPYADNIFYYAQHDIMLRASAQKPWTFCEIRPDAIVGFGEGSAVGFPGSVEAWEAVHTDTSQDILARFHIFASLRPQETSERAFNVVDGPATTWREVWPEVCAYFGLRGIAPESSDAPFSAQKWMEDHQSEWAKWISTNGLKEGALEGTSWEFMQAVIGIPFRRDYDASASRAIGFEEVRAHAEGYKLAFDEMRRAGFIP
ncbi:hypothetical protein B0A55_10590 [Friedmanniomyces simplex]|uniref:PRISE-like Rossmann-fold domain-containing protein n=1 Tax=Friedmanniomyces simplex TaxID=329884 RepID=A0A4U0WDE6_9PEZI|nr:hypothetical protein B0A55_10590 [Friedmanniomyces simplex]